MKTEFLSLILILSVAPNAFSQGLPGSAGDVLGDTTGLVEVHSAATLMNEKWVEVGNILITGDSAAALYRFLKVPQSGPEKQASIKAGRNIICREQFNDSGINLLPNDPPTYECEMWISSSGAIDQK